MAERRAQLDNEREELLGLAKYQCIGEPRLRELRAKWGQVFKAGMGAEAFHEILTVSSKMQAGDIEGARKASGNAKLWTWITFGAWQASHSCWAQPPWKVAPWLSIIGP